MAQHPTTREEIVAAVAEWIDMFTFNVPAEGVLKTRDRFASMLGTAAAQALADEYNRDSYTATAR